MNRTVILSTNSSWNLVNFRSRLIERLRREGFDLVALSPHDGHVPALQELGVTHVPVSIESAGLSPVADLKLLADYRKALSRIRPVAFLGWTIKPNIWGSLAAASLAIPVINNISGLGTAFIRTGPLTNLVQFLYRIALARSATVFFQNRHDHDLFVSQRLVRPEQSALLPGSGIDLADFAPRSEPEDVPFTFLMIARLLRDKGVVEFAEAAQLVRATRPDANFHLLGFLDVENRTAITRSTVEAWEREGVLRYLGATNDVRPNIAAAGAVVLPSYREGMPRSLLEAAAMAKPLIATDVPGCTEIARIGENAFLCKPRDATSLAAAMLAMLNQSPAARAAMGRRSRTIAEAEFDTAIVEEHYFHAVKAAMHASADR